MRVVKRCQFNGVFDGMQHRTVNGHAALELFAAMHHAMAHCVQVTAAGEPRSTLRRGDKRHQPLHRRAQVAQWGRTGTCTPIGPAQGDHRFATDALNLSPDQSHVAVVAHAIGVGGHHLKLECRRADVEHEDVHHGTRRLTGGSRKVQLRRACTGPCTRPRPPAAGEATGTAWRAPGDGTASIRWR